MLLVHVGQDIVPYVADLGSWSNLSQGWVEHSGLDWVLAQQFDTDVFKNTRLIMGDFVKSGKLWVLLAGIIVGYIIRSLTSYG